MSTSLVTPIKNISFMSDIGRIILTSSDPTVSVQISVSGQTIIDEAYVPDRNGTIRILEIGNAIKGHLSGIVQGDMVLSYTSAGAKQTVNSKLLYCDVEIADDTPTWLKKHFLTLATAKQIGSQWHEWISLYNQAQVTLSLIFTYSDGTSETKNVYSSSETNRIHTIDITPSKHQNQSKKVVAMTARATEGSEVRTLIYGVMQDYRPAAPRLIFRNSFGVEETFYCVGEHELKPTYETTNAVVEGELKELDIQETKMFTANTGALTTTMSNWADDIFRSPSIHILCVDNSGAVYRGKEIAIVSRKADRSNDDAFIASYSFEYRYAQRNHNIFDEAKAGRIFDNTFDTTYD